MKFIACLGAFVIMFAFPVQVLAETPAQGVSPVENVISATTTQEQIDPSLQAEADAIIAIAQSEDAAVPYGPQYHYKTEYYATQYKTISGFAGNQLPGGYRFPSGGGFWYTDSGGPSFTVSASLNFPPPYDMVSVSVNLGEKGSSGQYVAAPNTTDYFKLYVMKTVAIRPYAVLRARSGTEDWEVYHVSCTESTYSVSAYAKKV